MFGSGYNTSQALKALPEFMPTPQQATVRFMTILFGANDACLPGTQTGQHVPVSQYRQNLSSILEHRMVKAQRPRIILITPPPVDEYRREECDREKGVHEVRRTAEHTKLYADACREIGEEHDVVVLDLWSIFMRKAGWTEGMPLYGSKKVQRSKNFEDLLHDGLHFNPLAYEILSDELSKVMAQHWPDQTPEAMPFAQPAWEVAPAASAVCVELVGGGLAQDYEDYKGLAEDTFPRDQDKWSQTRSSIVSGPSTQYDFGEEVMDPQFAFASRDDIWRLQGDMKTIHATQSDHADRLLRLERRQDDDARMKSVWGQSSPFPSILSGTPQQDPGYNPAAEAFKNFDQDQQNGLLGSLHLDNDEEPRRGASRANSVRFDESALHGHFAQVSRSSSDFFPLRTGSGLGSHPMVERSSSHKSDGRQSSAGLSIHSARTNSLGLETSKILGRAGSTTDIAVGPPPGLFLLGPVPSIIRCWLDTNFSNETLLYAAVCTGSYKSFLSPNSVSRLGLDHQVAKDENGAHHIRIPVYLPEATVQQETSSRSASPAPQLPALTVNFTVQDCEPVGKAIQIFLGSDVLRAHNADILLSQDKLTLYDDVHNKLSIPLVRPEDASVYKNLVTRAQAPNTSGLLINGISEQQLRGEVDLAMKSTSDRSVELNGAPSNASGLDQSNNVSLAANTMASGDHPKPAGPLDPEQDSASTGREDRPPPPNGPENVSVNGTPTRPESGSIWGSWRRDSTPNTRADMGPSSNTTTGSGYQRAGRGSRGMKVLKPTKLGTTPSSRSFSATTPTLTGFDAAPPRFNDVSRRSSQTAKSDERDDQSSESRRSFSSEAKYLPGSKDLVASRSRSANPIGGASAFGWLNSTQQKRSAAAGES